MNSENKIEKIEIFRELKIVGESQLLWDFMNKISNAVGGKWTSEEIYPREYGGNMYCFRCHKTEVHPAAKLWFAQSDKQKIYVSNIVPMDMRRLTKNEYNQILMEFYESFIKPLGEPDGLKVTLEDNLVGLEHWIDEKAIQLLNSFSNLANKSTGTGHPLDERRWWLFCFYIHTKGYYPDFYPDILSRWLHEILGWSERSAESLSASYERTLRTLKQYDIYREKGTLP